MKAFNVKDGLGVRLLQEADITPVIITGRTSEIVTSRARKLGISEAYQGEINKVSILHLLCEKYQVLASKIAYIGDDLDDIDAIC